MRRRLILATTAVTTAVLIVAGIPVVLLVQRLARAEATDILRRQAEAIATTLADEVASGSGVSSRELARAVPAGDQLILVTGSGTRIETTPPVTGPTLHADVDAIAGSRLRLLTSARPAEDRIRSTLFRLALLAVAAIGAAAALAAGFAMRLAEPLEQLAASASRLGQGDFSATSPRSGVEEFDTIAEALDRSARRIASLVQAERQFSANASHQLRSALTGMRLRLESLAAAADHDELREDAEAALEQADRLTSTVDDLLRLARTGRLGEALPLDLADLARKRLSDVEPRLTAVGRPCEVVVVRPAVAHATRGAAAQALDVLLDNAVRHGVGKVTVTVDGADGGFTTVTVSDEGAGIASDDIHRLFEERPRVGEHGIGLPLARTLVEGDGGRLDLVGRDPTAFCLMLPAAPPDRRP